MVAIRARTKQRVSLKDIKDVPEQNSLKQTNTCDDTQRHTWKKKTRGEVVLLHRKATENVLLERAGAEVTLKRTF